MNFWVKPIQGLPYKIFEFSNYLIELFDNSKETIKILIDLYFINQRTFVSFFIRF